LRVGPVPGDAGDVCVPDRQRGAVMIRPAVRNNFQVDVPVDGPLDAEAFFARRPPASGVCPVPRLGCGTARFSTCENDGLAVLHAAWADGFLLTDMAPAYFDA